MKKAAGVSDVEEVVRRFETQEETTRHLQELQTRAEKEIRDLGAVKEKLESEWEVVKFMGQVGGFNRNIFFKKCTKKAFIDRQVQLGNIRGFTLQ